MSKSVHVITSESSHSLDIRLWCGIEHGWLSKMGTFLHIRFWFMIHLFYCDCIKSFFLPKGKSNHFTNLPFTNLVMSLQRVPSKPLTLSCKAPIQHTIICKQSGAIPIWHNFLIAWLWQKHHTTWLGIALPQALTWENVMLDTKLSKEDWVTFLQNWLMRDLKAGIMTFLYIMVSHTKIGIHYALVCFCKLFINW